jgi:glutaconate CoA-transferase subunit A
MSKVVTMKEAIQEFVRDGDVVYAAGFTHLIPFAAGHEMIRQGKRDLVLCRATPDLIYDQMVAAGCARKLVYSWGGNPGVGTLHSVRAAVEAGELEIEEYSHFSMISRLFAGAANLPFMILRANLGSDLPEHNPHLKTISCPYTGETLRTVPALKPDVAIIHAQRADSQGNTHIWGVIGEQREAAFAAKKVIVSVEEIVSPEVIRSDPNRTLIPDMVVSAVVEEPFCAHPSYAQGYYDRDNPAYIAWDEVSRSPEGTRSWLQEWVYGLPDRQAYVKKLGAETLLRLRPRSSYSVPVNYGIY